MTLHNTFLLTQAMIFFDETHVAHLSAIATWAFPVCPTMLPLWAFPVGPERRVACPVWPVFRHFAKLKEEIHAQRSSGQVLDCQ